MKLNLLPTYVGKERAARSAILLSVVLAAIGIGASVFMIISSREARRQSADRVIQIGPQAAQAVAESKKADLIIQNARVLILNTNLASAMDKHNYDYVDLYDQVRRYIPSFFRVTSMSATPAAETSVVTLTGTLQTQQQYADLMLALLRIPGATSVSRSNYQIVEKVVPPLVEGSQAGTPIERGQAPLPDDPLERMERYMSQTGTEGFLGVNNFGQADPTVRKGAMPNWSEVTVSVVVPKNIQTPNPRATLQGIGSAPGQGGAPAAGRPAGGGPAPAAAAPAGGPGASPGGAARGPDTGDEGR
jgi:hypothetical protein